MSSPFFAEYFDGNSSRPRRVEACWHHDARLLRLTGEGETLSLAAERIRIGDRLGQARRIIYLDGSGELHAGDQAAVEELARALGQGAVMARVFRLESRYSLALGALLVSLLLGWAGLRHGLPWLAGAAVPLVPPALEARLGVLGLDALDEAVFAPSALPTARQEALRQRLADVCWRLGDCPGWRMEFRAGGQIGANALALPGGILVFTDEIVKLAQHDDELVAVAAHELGHVRHRHVLRQILASTGVLVVGQVALGDVSGILDLAGGLPAILLQSGYSRDMEMEADAHALAMLERACLPPHRFSDLLARLDAAHGGELKAITLFSSHPDTRERLRIFQGRELVTRGC